VTRDQLRREFYAALDQARRCGNDGPCDSCTALAERMAGLADDYAAHEAEQAAHPPYRNRAERTAAARGKAS
jgi:hypothetical protein